MTWFADMEPETAGAAAPHHLLMSKSDVRRWDGWR
jgi:hypothetical protein